MTATEPVLDVRHLSVDLKTDQGWKTVVRPLSFTIHPGETLALVGESGSGKSVTANAIMQLLPPLQSRIQGGIYFGQQELLSAGKKQMQSLRGNRIGMIFQEPMSSLNPVLTIGTQITEVLKRHRGMDNTSARKEAIRLLERVRISAPETRLNAYPLHFSGGMRQRVVIAIALACQPALLIADEPTTALDVTVQAEILSLIKSLQKEENMAVLFITHDMGVVAQVADNILVMNQGSGVEMADTRTVFRTPSHPYTRKLISSVPVLGDMRGSALPALYNSSLQQPDTVQRGKPVLEVQELSLRFPVRSGWLRRVRSEFHAVDRVTLSLQPGETLGLVGESGCGKSTLARTIMRLINASDGNVLLEQQNLTQASGAQLNAMRRRIQLIFQDPWESLNPKLRIGEALAEPMLAHGIVTAAEATHAVAELLESVGLQADMAMRYPHQFSGGQRQRICIARALALQPAVIIADESVSALDVSVRAEIINLLMEIQRTRGISLLFISHDMAVVERISHRVAVMYQGQIVETGSRQAVLDSPAHPYTRHLLSAVPVPDPDYIRPEPEPFHGRPRTETLQKEPLPPLIYRRIADDHFVLAE